LGDERFFLLSQRSLARSLALEAPATDRSLTTTMIIMIMMTIMHDG
jgi:hypothetical protein